MAVTSFPMRKGTARSAERAGWLRVHIVWAQLGAIAAIMIALPFGRAVDPDFWWHLRTGELIFHSGIPTHDVFSFTVFHQSWVAHEWLSEVLIFYVQSVFGYAGNALLFSGAALGALGLMYALARQAGAGTKPLVALVLLSTVLLASFVTVRPQVFSWLLFAAFIYILERYERGDRASLRALPPLMVLWSNLHLGFVYGLVVVGVWVATKIWQAGRRGAAKLQEPITVATFCFLATVINPQGPSIFTYLVKYFVAGQTERSLIQEWQHPYFALTVCWPLLLASVLIGLSLLSRNRPKPYLCIISVIAIALSAQAARNIPFVALLLIPVAGCAAADRWRGARRETDSRLRISTPAAAAFAIALGAFVLTMSSHLQGALSGLQPSDASYPAAATVYLEQHAPHASVFNSYDWGGYLVDRLYPNGQVFIDGRADVYGPQVMRDYIDIAMAQPGWQALLDQYQANAVLFPPNTRLSVALRQDPAWQEVYMDSEASLFLRR
jgi:hypothetical protein